ncbi:MAG: type II secretion system F family protein [Planctomycetota bacterium]|nr:MAG: type II secretion system F family protein [Planctomycetota bacterium]REJ86698.1 MAG: type II secretion system F family protein [Planctomycetota bacterium]
MELLAHSRSFLSVLGPYKSIILPLAMFMAVTGSLLIVWRMWRRRAAARRAVTAEGEVTDDLFTKVAPALAAQLPESASSSDAFRRQLRGAGFYSPQSATRFYAARFLLFIAPLVLAGLAAVYRAPHDTFWIMLAGAVAAIAGSLAPRVYVSICRRRRQAEIREGLPDAIDMLAMCLEGGTSVGESLTHVAARLDHCPALAQELTILRRQAEVGSLPTALDDLARRVDLPELRGLCALLARGERLGTQVSSSLIGQSDHLRTQRRQLATMRANRAPVKLVLPLLLCFAPAALILLVSPAVLELYEFLAPSDGQSVLTAREQMAENASIAERLRALEQDLP